MQKDLFVSLIIGQLSKSVAAVQHPEVEVWIGGFHGNLSQCIEFN